MREESLLREDLTKFLARKGRTPEDLLGQVGEAFGSPLLVTAVGSVLEGFGNEESDVDLLAVVDAEVTDFPVSSHALDVPVDVNFLHTAWVRKASAWMQDEGRTDPQGSTRQSWKDSQRILIRLGRMSRGLVLSGSPEFIRWWEDISRSYPAFAAGWWRVESLRQREAGRLLVAAGRPLHAAAAYCSAGLALLESRAAELGEAYAGPKWIEAKLDRLGDTFLRDAFWQIVGSPVIPAEVPAYLDRVQQLLADLAGEDPLSEDPHLVLTPASGAKRVYFQGQVLWHRHGQRGLSSDDPDFAIPDDRGYLWHGQASHVPDDIRSLATAGLAWLAATERSAA